MLGDLSGNKLQEILNLHWGKGSESLVESPLLTLVRDVLQRPKKNLRGQLTKIGFGFGCVEDKSGRALELAFEMIEALHAGSLVVDDIEDGSLFRRGEPSLHRRYGLPLALNAGNWLYFWPLHLAKEMELKPSLELELYRLYHSTLLRAHFGQAIDIGTRIDDVPKDRVFDTCMASLELKSGTLTAFALGLGAIVGDCDPKILRILLQFGHEFGTGLQMLDDIGNFCGAKDPEKKWEDIKLGRPTWIWAVLASPNSGGLNRDPFQSFKEAVLKLPQTAALQDAVDSNGWLIKEALHRAYRFLDASLVQMKAALSAEMEPSDLRWRCVDELVELTEKLKHAYQ